MKKLFSILGVLAIVVGLWATVPVKVVLADCVTVGDVTTCDTTTDSGDGNGDTAVDANGVDVGAGDDWVTVDPGATVENCGDAISSDDDVSVANYGSIDGYCGNGIYAEWDVDYLYNAGTIYGDDEGVQADDLGDVENYGSIAGYWDGIDLDDNIDGIVNNYGEIVGMYGDGLDVGNNIDGEVNNFGVIAGYYGDGIDVDSNVNGDVNNFGIIATMDGDGVYVGNDVNGEVNNFGVIATMYGDGVYVDDDVWGTVNNFGVIVAGDDGIQVEDNVNLITNFGVIVAADDGIVLGNGGTVYNAGLIVSGYWGINGNDDDVIVINDGIIDATTGLAAIDTDNGDDEVYNNGALYGGSEYAVNQRDGDDLMFNGAPTVEYFSQCEDFWQAGIPNAPIVSGLMNGGDDYDVLVLPFATASEGEVWDALDATATSGGSFSWNGYTYEWANYEEVWLNVTFFDLADQKIYDDGVTLGFTSQDGVVVCNGPEGVRAASISFQAVKEGQLTFGANGFVVTLNPQGDGSYEVHVWKDGVEQFNDADEDGVADSLFYFGF